MARGSDLRILSRAVLANLRSWLTVRRGRIEVTGGTTHRDFSLEESLAYIDSVFSEYLRYSGLSRHEIQGARVLEVGPGDNYGVALRFLAAGAAQVTCVDRFRPWRDAEKEGRIYQALLDKLPPPDRERAASVLSFDGPRPRLDATRLSTIHGTGIEDAGNLLGSERFDLIVSCAVLEEISAPERALDVMERALRPGGVMVHRVDLRDYGLFTAHGRNPLAFLTVPEPVYRLTSSHSPLPNRRGVDWYRARLAPPRWHAEFLATRVIGRDPLPQPRADLRKGVDFDDETLALVEAARPRLGRQFSRASDRDLMLGGVIIVARKDRPNRHDEVAASSRA